MAGPGWVDGRLVEPGAPALPLDDSAFLSGLGCYTTARYVGGRVRLGPTSARRLARDALALGLGSLDADACLAGMVELGRACFGAAEGIVRFQASRGAAGPRVTGTARPLGDEPGAWSAVTAPLAHEGPGPWGGAKVTNHLRFVWAREDARARGADEALFFDRDDRLVEGARTSLVVVRADGGVVVPPLARGGVAGVGREVLLRGAEWIAEGDVARGELARARELIALNSVRGAVPVARWDGARLGDGTHPVAARLAAVLAADEEW